MTRRIVFAAGAAALLAATPAVAQQVNGLYVGAGAGVNFLQSNGLNQDDYDVGPAGNLYVGYGFGNGFRTDLEASIRENSHDGNSHQTTYGLMANGYYDFDFGSPFVPYIGGGVGVALVDADFNPSGPGNYFSSTKAQFAYQGIAGVAYNFAPNLAATLEYRYLGTTAPTFKDNGVRIKSDENNNHSILVGLRYTFGAEEAPPPQEVTQVTQARSYLVFFDFDSSKLTPEAKQIVGSAASDALQGRSTRIDVTGHTDRAGSDSYNQALSQRRAEAVRRELVADGVADSMIVTRGVGEADPLVPTADGVREPQNRRVEIVVN
ncbi:OmpA family protein [Inquilinus limosus]|uniref:OmpA family protein n=1 Tax=Inquilinus limosus TaxID=171674 RepID=UPI000428174D|nr:OmpA family protein [Inquilinus limosus]